LQVNPEKAQEGEDVAANLANVLNLAQVFFESILNSIRFFPPYVLKRATRVACILNQLAPA